MTRRRGLTLVEVVIAILVFAIGGLGLAASSAAVAKQISSSTLRARAASIARSRSETAQGSQCGSLASGEARTAGVYSVWNIAGGATVTLEQRLERSDARGIHGDRFLSAVACD
jgi:prepilin-type N-terminal cleavage/methylation domain-containing protein